MYREEWFYLLAYWTVGAIAFTLLIISH